MQKQFLCALMGIAIAVTACSDNEDILELRYSGSNGFVINGDDFFRIAVDCPQVEAKFSRWQRGEHECPPSGHEDKDYGRISLQVKQTGTLVEERDVHVGVIFVSEAHTWTQTWHDYLPRPVLNLTIGDAQYVLIPGEGTTTFLKEGRRLLGVYRGTLRRVDNPGVTVEVLGKFDALQQTLPGRPVDSGRLLVCLRQYYSASSDQFVQINPGSFCS